MLNGIGFVWEAKRGAPRQVVMSGEAVAPAPSSASKSSKELNQKTSATPQGQAASSPTTSPTSNVSPSRGMGPVSPTTSASSASYVQGRHPVPVARLPPVRTGLPYREDARYPSGGYPPNRQDAYYPPLPAQSLYPGAFHPSYPPPPIASASWPPESGHSPPHPGYSHAEVTWQMPRTGRILTPLYPMEPPPPPSRYPMAVPPEARYYDNRDPVHDTSGGPVGGAYYPHSPHQEYHVTEGRTSVASNSSRRRDNEDRRRTDFEGSHPDDRNRQC